MSKMKTPEMEVIRFKEADVIVTSGVVFSNSNRIRLTGFNNSTSGDGKIEILDANDNVLETITSQNYTNSSFQYFLTTYSIDNSTFRTWFYTEADSGAQFDHQAEDGIYSWDTGTNRYAPYQNQ